MRLKICVVSALVVFMTACQPDPASESSNSPEAILTPPAESNGQEVLPADPFHPSATLQELMLAVIDPNIDPIWNAVSTEITQAGVIETAPQTPEQWERLRQHAITLREVSNLLVLDGRKVAVLDTSTSSHASELTASEIEQLIRVNKTDFVRHAHALHAAADLTLQAIEKRDIHALEQAGALVEHSCESCHSQFWYPHDKVPATL